ncbi:conserved Plasmodium protein, unknown function [Plasmodium berghei]|uniref:Fam-c protein n=2 Tax=Plasmodium berghei TaxID=5821 RepID=A0A509AG37_PLABA|nr:conserved Plasmodium protein, unknown function [Plasmodium berghei ANKA]CXI12133.1 conserved Plasmodium protein, unknown function [Plasmodium berghei]SCL93316.1 conserved Plasmodium protein, unknown function [Plasmodium berghei]SCM15832.1 conserved Plasmodium protein, unknown function [Plasmodium berghei]SCM17627.1 conserved Plasmodium protein, unknown function [Plasmodium berghei]SCN23136.1 conserved Plasmodium protein, unknown function [Plasmodium berghei]|eukprot:XP_034420436.1 conserved Plasmodium protein, unknown function [Plasmodium berghei ANKA]
MNILYISFFFLGIFHFYKTASINEVSNTLINEKQNIDNSEPAGQKTSSTVNSENEGNNDLKSLENKDPSNDAIYHNPLPKNTPNSAQPKINKKGDNNNCEQSEDKKNTTNSKKDTKPHHNQAENKKIIPVKPLPKNDTHKSTNPKEKDEKDAMREKSEAQKNESKVVNNEHPKNEGAKPSKHKRKKNRRGDRYNTVKGINTSDIAKYNLDTLKEKSEEIEKQNTSVDDQPLNLIKKKI